MTQVRVTALPLVLAVVCASAGCGERASEPLPATPQPAWFAERAAETGLAFTHVNGMAGEYFDAEIFGPGVALFDYDNDEDLDVYVVQGQPLGRAPARTDLRDRLFRNDLRVEGDGRRTLRFTDVTEQSGVDVRSYGMGVAAGDFDNDGWIDLYVTRVGRSVLLRNNGNGTFTDVSRRSGTDHEAWNVSASWLDVDRDGWLDLYVATYLTYRFDADQDCFGRAGEPDYCDPSVYRPGRDRLYRNQRNGTFADVTARALAGGTTGPGLGVATADFDNDGWIDFYVANDRRENDLWINQRDGTFRNRALEAGVALNAQGRAEASMGVDAGDYDNDGNEDLVVANLTGEGSTLYRNLGGAVFEDVAAAAGVRAASLPYTGFGAAWLDADSDGWLDVLTVNGAVRTIEALARAGDPLPLHQRRQILRNRGDGRFEDATARAGEAFQMSDVGRGAAFGDVDNDGDTDVLVGNNNGPLRLFVNEARGQRHWLGIRLAGGQALGARVQLTRAGLPPIWRRARSDGSYASANDPRVLVWLGESATQPAVRVTWPDGHVQSVADLPIDRWSTVTRELR